MMKDPIKYGDTPAAYGAGLGAISNNYTEEVKDKRKERENDVKRHFASDFLSKNKDTLFKDPEVVSFLKEAKDQNDYKSRINKIVDNAFLSSDQYKGMQSELEWLNKPEEEKRKVIFDKEKEEIGRNVGKLNTDVSKEIEEYRKEFTPDMYMADTGTAIIPTIDLNSDFYKEKKGKWDRLQHAQNITKDTQKIFKEATNESKSPIKAIFRGVKDKVFDVNTWNLGVSDLDKNSHIKKAAEKFEQGEELTRDEQMLMDSLVENLAVNSYYGSDVKRQYKWGEIAGESLPFMLEFVLNPISASGKGLAKTIAKYGIKRLGAQGAGKTAVKAGARAIGDVVAAAGMTGTTGFARTAADALDRMSGEADFDLKDGKAIYTGHEGGESAVSSALKAVGANMLEYQSEMLGASGVGALAGKALPKGWTKSIKASGFGKFIGKNSEFVKNLRGLEKRAQWSGVLGEYGEEVYNTAMNAIIVGDQKLSDLTDIDQQIDTFMGLAITGGAMSGVNTAGYAADRVRTDRTLKTADQAALNYFDNWEKIKPQIEEMSVEDRADALKEVLKRNDISIPAKNAFSGYVSSLTYKEALTSSSDELRKQNAQKARQTGEKLYNTIQDKRSLALTSLNREKRDLESELGELIDIPVEEIEGMYVEPEIIEAARRYEVVRNEYNGIMGRLKQEIDEFLTPQIKTIESVSKDGSIVEVNLSDEINPDKRYVVKGNLILNEDGAINREASDKILYALDQNGKKMQVATSKIQSANIQNTEETKKALTEMAYQNFVDPLANKLDGVRHFEKGEQVEFVNDKGEAVAGSVVDRQGETVTILSNDGKKTLTYIEQDLQNRIVSPSLGEYHVRDQFDVLIDGDPYSAEITDISDGRATLHIPSAPDAGMRFMEFDLSQINAMRVPENKQESIKTSENANKNESVPGSEYDILQPESEIEEQNDNIEEDETVDFPRDKDGEIDYTKITDDTQFLSALQSDFGEESSEIVEEYKKNADKKLKNASKINDPIKRKRAQRKAQAEIDRFQRMHETLNPKTSYEERIEAIGEGSIKKRESNMGEYLSLRDYLLRNIATGRFKFMWNSDETRKGLKDEILASKNTESERRKRIAFLNNTGYTPESLAHEIWENAGQGSEITEGWFNDIQDIRNEINDILLSHDTPTSMIDAATELRRRPESTEEYYENFVDPQIIEQYKSAETEEATSLSQLPFEAMTDEELSSYFDDLEDFTNFEEKNNGLEGRRTETDRPDVAVDSESTIPGRENGDSAIDEAQGKDDSNISEETAIAGERSAPDSTQQPDQGNAEHEHKRSIDVSERSIDEIVSQKNEELDREAEKVDTNPSEAQKEAGNYKMGHVNVQGFDITIENPRGSVRSGTDKNGKTWSIEMQNHYGYFKRTEGKDGDHIDVFVGPNPESQKVFVVDQVEPGTTNFDESKTMLGFNSIEEARDAYLSNYEEGWQGLGTITETNVDDFKKWLYDGKKQRKAFAEYKNNKEKILDVNGYPILSADEWNSLSEEEQKPLKNTITKSVTDLDGNNFSVDYNLADPLQRIINAGYATGQSDSGTTTDHPGYRYIKDDKQGKYKQGDLIRGGSYLTFWRPEAVLIQETGRRINTQGQIDAIISAVNKTGFVYDFTDVFYQPSIRISLRQANDGTKDQTLLKEADALTDEAYPGLHDKNFFEWLEYRNETYLPIVEQKHGGIKEWTDNEIINKWNELANELEKESDMGIPISDKTASSDIPVMTEEQYLSINGAPFMKGAEPALHKNIKPDRNKDKNIERVQKAMIENNQRREELRAEYADKITKGEIRKPTRTEELIRTANGHPDNEATQAARRLLEKRGVNWENSDNYDNFGKNNVANEKGQKYTTQSGRQLEFEFSEGVQVEETETVDTSPGTGDIQRENNPLANKLGRLKKGEFAHVERVFTEKKHFSFTGSEKIETIEDVVAIFDKLEDDAIENSFAVFIKDGIPTIQHLGMGNFSGVLVNIPAMIAAADRLNPDTVYFIHNHPSGQLKSSPQDVGMLKMLRGAFGDKLQDGIIINLKTGKYATFNEYGSEARIKSKEKKDEIPLKVYSFDKLVFEKDYDPESLDKITSSRGVAEFISSHRLGDRDKISFLVLDRGNRIVGNFFTSHKDITSKNASKLADYVNSRVITYGGSSAIIYGGFNGGGFQDSGLSALKWEMNKRSGGEIPLLDAVSVKKTGYVSAADEGILEPKEEYKKQSADSNKGAFDPRNDDIRFRIIGETGAERMQEAEAVISDLNTAKEMETGGKDAKTIRVATGWEKGVDGLWRYEQPDEVLTRKDYDTLYYDGSRQLLELIPDSELLKLYPQLADTRVRIGRSPGYGHWDRVSNEIVLSFEAYDLGGKRQIRSDIASFKNTLENGYTKQQKDAAEIFGGLLSEEQLREKIASLEEKLNDTSLINGVFVHELQHAIQDIEGFARGGSPKMFSSPSDFEKASKELDQNVKTLDGDKYENIGRVLFDERFSGYRNVFEADVKDGEYLIDGMQRMYRSMDKDAFMGNYEYFVENGWKGDAYDQYRKVAGEVEARNAERRVNLTPEERRSILLSETADVAPEQQTVLMDAVEQFSGKIGKNDVRSADQKYNEAKTKEEKYEAAFEVIKVIESVFKPVAKSVIVRDTEELKRLVPKGVYIPEGVSGMYNNGHIYINVEGNPDSGNILDTWIHESNHAVFTNEPEKVIPLLGKIDNSVFEKVLPRQYWNLNEYQKVNELFAFLSEDMANRRDLPKNDVINNEVKPLLEEFLNQITDGRFSQSDPHLRGRGRRNKGPRLDNQGGVQQRVGRVGEGETYDQSSTNDRDNGPGGEGVSSEGGNEAAQGRISRREDRLDAGRIIDSEGNLGKVVPDYNGFLNNVFQGAKDKQAIYADARSKGMDLKGAIEKYLSEINDPEELSRVRELLGIDVPDNVLRHILWRNANPNDGSAKWKAEDALKRRELDGNVLFRKGDPPSKLAFNEYEKRIRSRYNKGFRSLMFGIEEGYFDRMSSLRILQNAITGNKSVPDRANAYMLENQLSSKNTAEIEHYSKNILDPMYKAAVDVFGKDLKSLDDYLLAKHGLERNEHMAKEEAKRHKQKQLDKLQAKRDNMELTTEEYAKGLATIHTNAEKKLKELLQKDYSGLTALAEGDDFKGFAESLVKNVEDDKKDKIENLWNSINKATKWMLQKQYDSGMMTKETFGQINDMYKFYVPLRGFSETVATDLFEYILNEPSDFNSVLKNAKGRTSRADSPFASILNMGESGIMQANKNKMKQAFYRLVSTNPSNYASINDIWLVKQGEDWVEKFPDIPENATGDQVWEAIADFNNEMSELEAGGLAVRGKNKLDLGVKIGKAQASEHAVRVWIGGEEKVIYINGNPRAAQAINGLTNSSAKDRGKIMTAAQFWMRQMAANFTSRNPAFMVTNFMRDIQFALVSASVKEGGRYSAQLAINAVQVPKTIAMNIWGNGGGSYQKYWDEFLANGGETGYASLHSIDYQRKFVNNKLRELNGQRDFIKPFRAYAEQVSNANRLIEDISRFSTYVTSRQAGRSIERSVADAKDITINFNRKGSGGFGADILHGFYLFANPALQSLRQMGMMAKRNPVRFISALSMSTAMGFMAPLINEFLLEMFGGDDDKESYTNLSDWTRRNHLVLYTPWMGDKKFITLALPHELRGFYGLGEMAYSANNGKLRHENVPLEGVKQLANMLPVDPTGGRSSLVPDVARPLVEAYWFNRNFMDRPIYKDTPWNKLNPEWMKAYKGTHQYLVEGTKWLNEISGGDDVVKGKIDINPAKIQHVFGGYTGGAWTTYTDLVNLAYDLISGEDVSINQVPIANKIIKTSDDRTKDQRINSEYFFYQDWMRDYEHRKQGYNKRLSDEKYQDKYKNLLGGDETGMYMYGKMMTGIIKDLMEHDEEAANQMKEDFVEEMWEMENNK